MTAATGIDELTFGINSRKQAAVCYCLSLCVEDGQVTDYADHMCYSASRREGTYVRLLPELR